jgi:TPP-dependent trihydroxycyclohexane-1,2-dione (THcHDO) dehydratase
VKNAVGEGTSAASEAWDIIKNAAERLAKAGKNFAPRLGGNGIAEKSFTTEELQQLRTIYGVDTSKMTVISVSWWKRILTPLGSLKKTWNDVKKQVSPLIADVKNVIHDVQEVLNDYKKSKQQRQEEKEKNEQEKENAKFLVEEKVMLSDRERESIL